MEIEFESFPQTSSSSSSGSWDILYFRPFALRHLCTLRVPKYILTNFWSLFWNMASGIKDRSNLSSFGYELMKEALSSVSVRGGKLSVPWKIT